MNSEQRSAYRCVSCLSEPLVEREHHLWCLECQRGFPVVAGIPILTHRPRALLAAALTGMQAAQAAFDQTRDVGSHTRQIDSDSASSDPTDRAARVARATAASLNTIAHYMQPVAEYARVQGLEALSPLDWIASYAGGEPEHVSLPFFYQDWGHTGAFAGVRSLILDALRRHAADTRTLAVVGSGAGGLLYACAPFFDVTYGIDLSVPTTLMAQGVLSGDSIGVPLPAAQWRIVPVAGPAAVAGDIRLAVADAAALPFADASLSVVVTQYLMDLVGNPLAVAAEIGRVLEPGGVWVNFSMPFALPDDPPELGPVQLEELPGLLRPLGFEMCESERQRFTLLDVTAIDPGANQNRQTVHFFVARQISASRPGKPPVLDEAWWGSVPKPMPGRVVQLVRRRTFDPRGARDCIEISVASGVAANVPPAVAGVVERLFDAIDGVRSLQEIHQLLIARGLALSTEDLRQLFLYLTRHYGAVDLSFLFTSHMRSATLL